VALRPVRLNRSRNLRRALAPSENPNGIPSQSPGLRGTSYLGSPSVTHFQPQRGCGPSSPCGRPPRSFPPLWISSREDKRFALLARLTLKFPRIFPTNHRTRVMSFIQMSRSLCAPIGVLLLALAAPASAQIIISGNENKIDLTSGTPKVIPPMALDSISI